MPFYRFHKREVKTTCLAGRHAVEGSIQAGPHHRKLRCPRGDAVGSYPFLAPGCREALEKFREEAGPEALSYLYGPWREGKLVSSMADALKEEAGGSCVPAGLSLLHLRTWPPAGSRAAWAELVARGNSTAPARPPTWRSLQAACPPWWVRVAPAPGFEQVLPPGTQRGRDGGWQAWSPKLPAGRGRASPAVPGGVHPRRGLFGADRLEPGEGRPEAREASWAWAVGPRPLPFVVVSSRPFSVAGPNRVSPHRWTARAWRGALAARGPTRVSRSAPRILQHANCPSRAPSSQAACPFSCLPAAPPAAHQCFSVRLGSPADPAPPQAPVRRLFCCNRLSLPSRFYIAERRCLIPQAQSPLRSPLGVQPGLSNEASAVSRQVQRVQPLRKVMTLSRVLTDSLIASWAGSLLYEADAIQALPRSWPKGD